MKKEFALAKSLAYEQRYREAREILLALAEKGYGPALYVIGNWYAYGRACRKNFRLASEYFALAADAGYADAYYDLRLVSRWEKESRKMINKRQSCSSRP